MVSRAKTDRFLGGVNGAGRLALACLSIAACLAQPAWAAPPAATNPAASPAGVHRLDTQSEFAKRLVAPMASTVDGTPFREALLRIADSAGVNLWLDRTVDPSAAVTAGSLGPTAYDCLATLAASQNCVVFPFQNVVLVGRAERVDHAALAIALALSGNDKSQTEVAPGIVTVQWETLTTPTEAFARVAGTNSVALPHDLWPATVWNQIDRRVAASLVLAQFDEPLASDADKATAIAPKSGKSKAVATKTTTVRFQYEYRPSLSPEIRSGLAKIDSGATVTATAAATQVTSTSTAHRWVTNQVLATAAAGANQANQAAGGQAVAKLKSDPRKFSLKLVNKPAGQVLASLAASAGVPMQPDPDAAPALATTISLEVADASLIDLIEQVSELATLEVIWEADRFRVRPLVRP